MVNLKKNGIPPYSYWERYLERFGYDIKIECENLQTNFKQDIGYEFVNGEYFRGKDGILVSSYSRIKSLVMVWWVDNVKYTGHFILMRMKFWSSLTMRTG